MIKTKGMILKGLVFLCLMMLTCGCGKELDENKNLENAKKEVREFTEVLDKAWVQPSTTFQNSSGWEIVEYVPDNWELEDLDQVKCETFVTSDDKYLYILRQSEGLAGNEMIYEYDWKAVDLVTQETCKKSSIFSEEDFLEVFDSDLARDVAEGLKTGYAKITSLDVCNDETSVFLTVWNETWEIRHFYFISLTLDGKLQKAREFMDFAWPEGEDRKGQFNIPEAYWGNNETLYLLDNQNGLLRLVSGSGEAKGCFDVREISRSPVQFAGKTPNDIPVFFAQTSHSEKEFFYVDENGIHNLWKGSLEASLCRLDFYGYMILLQGDRLLTWNVLDGEVTCLYQLTGLSAYSCEEIARNANGELLMYYVDKEDQGFMYRLNDADHPDIRELVLLQSFQDEYTSKCAADYARTHPGVQITVKQLESQSGLEWQKLIVDIKDGQGPDLILANRERIGVFEEAGILMPITKLVPEIEKEKIFTGALKFGMFGNELYALPSEASLGIWMIRRDLIPKGPWELESIMTAYEEWKSTNPKARRVECLYFNVTSTQLLYDMCLQNLENCEFVDFQNNKCNFENESFYHLLRFCLENGENYDTDTYLTRSDVLTEMREGEAFLYYLGGGLVDYSDIRNALGDLYCTIGYPSQNKPVGMIHCYRGVAVSEMSENKDIAIDFLLSLISEDSQAKYTTYWINRNVLIDNVKDRNGDKDSPYFQLSRKSNIPLKGREDGTSYLDEYLKLMDEGEPLTTQYAIRDMVIEEAIAFFAGDKSEFEAAEIIQNRVQNYLNEQN
ncbi:MAG: extracellular solute-binding protein [Acetatifactor sp.]|nr:extracellular solute-binding protein [Acetatifactor sp.]